MISVLAIAAVAGIGFATYTSSASVTVTANAGSFYLTATGDLTASSLAVGTCTSSAGPSGSITLTATNMLPGDYCNWTYTITDAGSLPGTFVTYTFPGFSGPGCSQLTTIANYFAHLPAYPVPSVSPGGTVASAWTNTTDTGSGAVSGSCSGTGTWTYQAA